MFEKLVDLLSRLPEPSPAVADVIWLSGVVMLMLLVVRHLSQGESDAPRPPAAPAVAPWSHTPVSLYRLAMADGDELTLARFRAAALAAWEEAKNVPAGQDPRATDEDVLAQDPELGLENVREYLRNANGLHYLVKSDGDTVYFTALLDAGYDPDQ